MDKELQFRGKVRYFRRPELKSGLAVMDIPKAVAAELGGLNVGDHADVSFERVAKPR